MYSFIAASFGATLTQVSLLTLSRALTQALLSPLGGYLGHVYNRAAVISAGACVWGATMVGFAFATSLGVGIACWAVTGFGLCLVIPSVQSLTADLYAEADRGKAFGALHLTSALGAALGGLYATNVAASSPFGWDGWRFAMLLLGFVSFGTAALNAAFARDPRAAQGSLRLAPLACDSGPGPPAFAGELLGVLRVPTFTLIVFQGIVGNVPGAALGFQTLYLQLLGVSAAWASALVSASMGAHAAGGLLGGWVGDAAARWSPRHGRILACQASVVMGALATVWLLRGLPRADVAAHVGSYLAVFLLAGAVNSWPAPACNNPIFAGAAGWGARGLVLAAWHSVGRGPRNPPPHPPRAPPSHSPPGEEIVPARARNIVYAFDRSFEMAVAALAVPAVGVLAERVFGFDVRVGVGRGGLGRAEGWGCGGQRSRRRSPPSRPRHSCHRARRPRRATPRWTCPRRRRFPGPCCS